MHTKFISADPCAAAGVVDSKRNPSFLLGPAIALTRCLHASFDDRGRPPNALSIACLTGAIVFAVASTGCAVTDSETAGSVMARQVSMKREATFNFAWRGKPSADLVDNLGQPKTVMTVPGRNDEKTYVMVYGVQDRTAACVDAFTVEKNPVNELWIVAGYFCR